MNLTDELDLVTSTVMARESGLSRQMVHRLIRAGKLKRAGRLEDDAGKIESVFTREKLEQLKQMNRNLIDL